jgi:predicted PurR-regulated permease PerM
MDNTVETPPPPPQWTVGERALVVLAVLALIAAAKITESFMVPVVAGVMLSYALEPLVRLLERVRIPRVLGAAVVLLLTIATVAGSAYLLRADATALVAELPDAAKKLRTAAHDHRGPDGPMDHVRAAAAELNKAAAEATGGPPAQVAPAPPNMVTNLQSWLTEQSTKIIGVIGQFGVAFLLAYFLLAAGDTFRRKVVHLAGPTLAKRRITVEILDDIHVQVQRYLLVLVATNLLIALAIWGVLLAFGIERAGLWGAVAGILHIVPYAGTAVTTAAISVAAYVQTGSLGNAAGVGFVVLAVSSAIGMGLVPWLQGRASSMNAVAVFVSLLFFGWLWGGWGLLLGAPLIAVLKTIADRVPRMDALGELLGGANAPVRAAVATAGDGAASAGAPAAERAAARAPEASAGPSRAPARRRRARATT